MRYFKLFAVLVLLGLAMNFTPIGAKAAEPSGPVAPLGWWTTTRAYKVDHVFDDPPFVPHYGALFNGTHGYNQHYLGPGGDAATCNSGSGCISAWNWWGTEGDVLLLPKCWLFSTLCVSGQIPDHWNAQNYQATMFFD